MSPSALYTSMSELDWKDPDELRTDFTLALSAMYKSEVPLYGNLVRIVDDVNTEVSGKPMDPTIFSMRYGGVTESRINIERHGAIRLGTEHELYMIRRIFAIIGLKPVGYYDLSIAGLPMHATCFRPQSQDSLEKNPFRVFTSVLRTELLQNDKVHEVAVSLLSKRDIFSAELKKLLDLADAQHGRLAVGQASQFVLESMKTFSWHSTAAATLEEYQLLRAEHPILADIACFNSCHVNHLTPRTLDIKLAQEMMTAQGLKVKDRIEGPPARKCPILLRQTSFLAIEEAIHFLKSSNDGSEIITGSHKARFGEIEERGAAVTLHGRRLYDQLLEMAMEESKKSAHGTTPEEVDRQVNIAFQQYPDDWEELRKRHLVHFKFEITEKGANSKLESRPYKIDDLIEGGLVKADPITYEDFLPLSAAGIFQSNLGSKQSALKVAGGCEPGTKLLERALGVTLPNHDTLYMAIEKDSLAKCESLLNIEIEV